MDCTEPPPAPRGREDCPMTHGGASRTAWLGVQGLVTVGLLWLLVRGLALALFEALFLRLPLWFYLTSLLVVLGGQVLYAWRWHVLLNAAGVEPPFSVTMRQYFIGIFLNNFLPSTVGGDVEKVYLLGREYGYRRVTASIMLDRLLGIGMLALVSAMAMWTVADLPPALRVARLATTGVAVASVVILA